MSQKIMSFDIEIADVFDAPEGTDIDQFAPFHVSVAATAVPDREKTIWYSRDADGKIADHLSPADARNLLYFLREAQERGYSLCAWNGLSFDLKWIGYAAGNMDLAREIALDLYDPMFQFFMYRGFPVALAKVAQAMGVHQVKSMSGADAPKQWVAGNHGRVIDYVIGDCEITNAVIAKIVESQFVRWVTQRGTVRAEPMPVLHPVRHLLDLPMPDQSWMDSPIPREKFMGWLNSGGDGNG